MAEELETGLGFDPEALRKRYRLERDKRLRSDGLGQYVPMEGRFASYAEDPFATPEFTRAPRHDTVDVAVVGGGFSGLIIAGKLRQAGVDDICVIEAGSDFGGTWYWNRYPGIRCDVESYIYMPFLEELGYLPSEKYARGEEILAHCQAIGRHFDLYANACLQTQVTGLDWDEDEKRWTISTDRGDRLSARFVCLAGGGMNNPKLPGIPGIEEFGGESFHTSRWNYAYTGGSGRGDLTGLKGKRVGIIGTGASAIQCIPYLAESAAELFVFQRTPSTVDVRNNKPTDPAWGASLQPGWQQDRIDNFTAIVFGVAQDQDLVADRWTAVWSRLWAGSGLGATSEFDAGTAAQMVDYQTMEEIRGRVDSVVTDRATAEALKPWYNFFCKRPLYSDEFLQTFNRANVTLVDTQGRGVERVTAAGPVVEGVEYPVDCLIYATGFTVGRLPYEIGAYKVVGRDGVDLASAWAEDGKSLHGLMSRGFPNLFVHGHTRQATATVNVPHGLSEQAGHVSFLISGALKEGVKTLEATPEAEAEWAATLAANHVDRSQFQSECTPGYFNDEGQEKGPMHRIFGGGPLLYMDLLRRWRAERIHEDLEKTF